MSGEQPSVEMVDCSDRVKPLYRAAKLIKSEVTNCRGIAIMPPSVVDSSLTNAKLILITSKLKKLQKSKITLEVGKWVGPALILISFF